MSIGAVFSIGGKRTPAIDIFLWANEPQVGCVSKLFREVHHKIVEPETRKIRNAAIGQHQLPLPEPIPNGLSIRQFLEEGFREVGHQVDALFPVLHLNFLFQRTGPLEALDTCWERMVQVNNRLWEEADVPTGRLYFYLNEWDARLRRIQSLVSTPRCDFLVLEEVTHLVERLKERITRENLMWRFRLIHGQHEPNLSHLSALARMQQANVLRDAPVPRIGYDRYRFDRFLQGEQRILSTEHEKDSALCVFIRRIRFPAGAAPPLPLRASRIRDFLQDPARAVHEEEDLMIFDLPILPPEVGKFVGLKQLYCERINIIDEDDPFSGQYLDRRLVQLPETLVNLIHLEKLDLRGNALSEIPEFLARMPALSTLNLEGNPIRKIPDSVWRHLNGWQRLGVEYLATFLGNRQEEEKKWLFGLPRNQLTEIPFALWFKENCTLPYIWLNIESWCRVFRDWHIIPAFFAFVATEIIGLLSFIPNTASFLINVFLLKVVEPIITQVRDALGYDRHVAGR